MDSDTREKAAQVQQKGDASLDLGLSSGSGVLILALSQLKGQLSDKTLPNRQDI